MPNRGTPVKGTWVEDIIVQTYLKKPTLQNKEIHREVIKGVKEELKRRLKGPELTAPERRRLNDLLKINWPGLSVVEKLIVQYRKKHQENIQIGATMAEVGVDAPWNMATLEKYSLPSETLPSVLQVWKLSVEKGTTFTIRDAIWVSRLSAVEKDIEFLSFIAHQYAEHDQAASLTGYLFNSIALDKWLVDLPLNWYEDMVVRMWPQINAGIKRKQE